jgi:hypothetical protein
VGTACTPIRANDCATRYKRDAAVAHVMECLLEFTTGRSDIAAARCGRIMTDLCQSWSSENAYVSSLPQ